MEINGSSNVNGVANPANTEGHANAAPAVGADRVAEALQPNAQAGEPSSISGRVVPDFDNPVALLIHLAMLEAFVEAMKEAAEADSEEGTEAQSSTSQAAEAPAASAEAEKVEASASDDEDEMMEELKEALSAALFLSALSGLSAALRDD